VSAGVCLATLFSMCHALRAKCGRRADVACVRSRCACTCRQFLSAWEHVSAMRPAKMLEEFSVFLTSPDPVRNPASVLRALSRHAHARASSSSVYGRLYHWSRCASRAACLLRRSTALLRSFPPCWDAGASTLCHPLCVAVTPVCAAVRSTVVFGATGRGSQRHRRARDRPSRATSSQAVGGGPRAVRRHVPRCRGAHRAAPRSLLCTTAPVGRRAAEQHVQQRGLGGSCPRAASVTRCGFQRTCRARVHTTLTRGVVAAVVQLAGPLEPVLCQVGDPFTISACCRVKALRPSFLVLVCGPATHIDGASVGTRGSTYPTVTAHTPMVEALGCAADGDPDAVMYRVTLNCAPFPRSGFYDWRIVTVTPGGEPLPVTFTSSLSRRQRAAQQQPDAPRGAPTGVCQGRFIVHSKDTASQHLHEVVVDLQVRLSLPSASLAVYRRRALWSSCSSPRAMPLCMWMCLHAGHGHRHSRWSN
jgi:hypothetical protein